VPLSQVMAEIRGTILNPSLMVVMASGFCSGVAIGMGTALSQYFYVELCGLTAKFVSYISIAGVLASLSGVALAGPAARLMGKKHAMITLFTMSIIADALPQAGRLLGFIPPNSSPWVLRILVADGFFAGTLAIAGYIIISSMIADVVEDAAVKTGVRSEGLLMAANGLLPKFTNGFGVFLAGVVITVAQFPVHAPPGSVSPDIMRHMSLLFLPFSTFMKGLSVFVLFFYRIDEAKHRENLETLAQAAAMAEIADIEDARPSSVAAGSTVV